MNELFAKANALGQQASRQTGVAFTAINPAARTTGPAATPTNSVATTPVANDVFMEELQKNLMKSADLVSSEDTSIERSIRGAIGSIQAGQEANARRIESAFGRELEDERRQFSSTITNELEQNRGFAINVTALRELTQTGQKRLDDLEQRKQELLLQGSAEAAGKIAELQLKELDLQQQARQRTFTNLLSMANFGLQARQEQRLSRAQSFTERSKIAEIGLQFGIPVSENDTLDSIITRVAPLATEKQQLELARMRADINRINAETSKAMQGQEVNLDPVTAAAFAELIVSGLRSSNPDERERASIYLGAIGKSNGMDGILAVENAIKGIRTKEFSQPNLQMQVSSFVSSGQTKEQALAHYSNLVASGVIDSTKFAEVSKIIEEQYPKPRSIFDSFRRSPQTTQREQNTSIVPNLSQGYQPLNINPLIR